MRGARLELVRLDLHSPREERAVEGVLFRFERSCAETRWARWDWWLRVLPLVLLAGRFVGGSGKQTAASFCLLAHRVLYAGQVQERHHGDEERPAGLPGEDPVQQGEVFCAVRCCVMALQVELKKLVAAFEKECNEDGVLDRPAWKRYGLAGGARLWPEVLSSNMQRAGSTGRGKCWRSPIQSQTFNRDSFSSPV